MLIPGTKFEMFKDILRSKYTPPPTGLDRMYYNTGGK